MLFRLKRSVEWDFIEEQMDVKCSPNRHFEIPADEHGKVVIRWRQKNAPDDV